MLRQKRMNILTRAATGLSKLANILHIKQLQRLLNSENVPITCISVHPGPVATVGANGFMNSVPYLGWFIAKYIGPLFFVSWRQGAMTSAFAAASKEIQFHRERYEGVYLTPVARISEPSSSALDPRLASELYDTTHEVLKELGL